MNEHNDRFRQLSLMLGENAIESSKKLREDLEKYENIEEATDAELKQLLTANRLLSNSVIRHQQYHKDQAEEIENLKLKISVLEADNSRLLKLLPEPIRRNLGN